MNGGRVFHADVENAFLQIFWNGVSELVSYLFDALDAHARTVSSIAQIERWKGTVNGKTCGKTGAICPPNRKASDLRRNFGPKAALFRIWT